MTARNNAQRLRIDDTGSVVFTLRGEREGLTDRLVQHFAGEGWGPRNTQHLNPQSRTSFEEGWQSRCGCVMLTDFSSNPIPREPYYQWHGEWQNPRGDLVTYDLSAEGRQLRGYASYIPLKVVDKIRRRLGR